MINVDEYASKIFNWNRQVGWWDDLNRCVFQALQLVNTEIAEATEGNRRNLMDDHLPHRKMEEVELADVFLRLADLGGRYGRRYDSTIKLPDDLKLVDENLAAQHFFLTTTVCVLGGVIKIDGVNSSEVSEMYSISMALLFEIAKLQNYDLKGAIDEKFEYNKTRIDHTRGHRGLHFDGKRY